MKYFLVVLLAAAVTAAPQSTPNLSFDEYALHLPVLSEFGLNLENYWENLKCAHDVVTQAVLESEFKQLWDDYKAEIEKLATVEWQKCIEEGDLVQQTKCKAAVVQTALEAIRGFVQKLAAANKWALVKEIKEKVVAKCFEPQSLLFEFNPDVEQFKGVLLEQFECLAEVLDIVSKGHSLDELWSKSQPQLQHHLGKWKDCNKVQNAFLAVICKVKEGTASFAVVNEYIKLAAAKDPTFIEDFGNEFKETCGVNSYAEGIEAHIHKLDTKLKCILEATSEAVQNTKFHAVWEQAKKELQQIKNKLQACKNEQNEWAANECINTQLKDIFQILSKFLDSLKEANQDAYKKVRETIQKKCYTA